MLGAIMDHYDAIVIGAGQAGTPLTIALGGAGRKTALVESQHVGGTCINEGCTPTKTMVASARIAYLARRAADYGICCGNVGVDMASAQNGAAEDPFIKIGRSVDVGNRDEICDGEPLAGGHLIALLFDLYGVH
jgi:hypothetical protein